MTVPAVVVIAPRDVGADILSVLHDWSAVGLVEPFLWVDAEVVAAGPLLRVPGVAVVAGRLTVVDGREYLADSGRPDVLRVCAVDPLQGPSVRHAAGRLLDYLASSLPGVATTRVHVALTYVGMQAGRAFDVTDGWHNIVLAPEEASSAESPRVLVTAEDDPNSLAMHYAAGLAGLLGLWASDSQCPLEKVDVPLAQGVRLARSYLYWLDAEAVESAIQNALTEVSDALPRPTHEGRRLDYVEDDQAAVEAAAEGLLSTHEWLLVRRREPGPPDQRRPMGLAESLRMLFSFVWAALRRAPRDWLHRVVQRASTSAAGFGQRAVFGDSSAYEVVVNGRAADGRMVSWDSFDSSLARLRDQLVDVPRHREQPHDLSLFWRDFVGVALGLVDGRHRVLSVPLPTVGGRPAVVRSPAKVAPPSSMAFVDLPPHISAQLGVRHVAPSQILAAERASADLADQARDTTMAYDMADARSSLQAWQRTVQSGSYTGQVGQRLTARIAALQDELRQRAERIRGMGVSTDDNRLAEQQESLSRRTRWTSVAALVVVVAFVVAGVVGWWAWTTVLAAAAATVLVWLLALLTQYVIGQRQLFQLLNRLHNDEARLAVEYRNLAAAVDDIDRVARAYRQFEPWGTVLGQFLDQPFGPPSEPGSRPPVLSGSLPRCVRIGMAEPGDSQIAAVVDTLREQLFGVGWAEDAYLRVIENAAPSKLYDDAASQHDSPLLGLAHALRTRGVPAACGAVPRSHVSRLLGELATGAQRSLLLSSTTWSGQGSAEAARPERVSVDGSLPFDGTVVAAEARATGVLQPTQAVRLLADAPSGLTQRWALTELTDPIHPSHLVLGESGTRSSANVAPPTEEEGRDAVPFL